MTTCHIGLHPASESHYTSPHSSPRPSKSVDKQRIFSINNYIANILLKRTFALKHIKKETYPPSAKPVQDMIFKLAARSVITICADQNTLSQCGWFCSRADADLFTFHLSDIHVRICVHGCVG